MVYSHRRSANLAFRMACLRSEAIFFCFVSEAYDILDPNGHIIISRDILYFTKDGYEVLYFFTTVFCLQLNCLYFFYLVETLLSPVGRSENKKSAALS